MRHNHTAHHNKIQLSMLDCNYLQRLSILLKTPTLHWWGRCNTTMIVFNSVCMAARACLCAVMHDGMHVDHGGIDVYDDATTRVSLQIYWHVSTYLEIIVRRQSRQLYSSTTPPCNNRCKNSNVTGSELTMDQLHVKHHLAHTPGTAAQSMKDVSPVDPHQHTASQEHF